MKILTRYFLREHLAPFLFAGCALTGLLVLNELAKRFGSLIGKGLDWATIGSVFGLSLPFILAMTIPMAVLVAVLHAFGRMAADSEITALKANGVHLGHVVRPVLFAAVLISMFEFAFVDQVLPRANHRLKNLLVDIARKKPTFELKEQMVNEVVPGQLFLRAGRIDPATDGLRDVVIHDLADGIRRRTIYADSGFVRFNPGRTDLFLTLFDGYVHDYDRSEAEVFRRIFFKTDVVRVAGVSNELQRTEANDFRGDREMSVCEMEKVVNGDFRNAHSLAADRRRLIERDALALVRIVPPPPDTMLPGPRWTVTTLYCALLAKVKRQAAPAELSAAEVQRPQRPAVRPATRPYQRADSIGRRPSRMPQRPVVAADPVGGELRGQMESLASRRRTLMQHAASFQVEIHKKFTLAISCIVFVMIGAPVALRFPRGGIGVVIGASVIIFGIYYIGLIGGESFADRGTIPPFWAMWTPNLIMAGLGAWMFSRLGREKATGREQGSLGRLVRLPAAALARFRRRRAR